MLSMGSINPSDHQPAQPPLKNRDNSAGLTLMQECLGMSNANQKQARGMRIGDSQNHSEEPGKFRRPYPNTGVSRDVKCESKNEPGE